MSNEPTEANDEPKTSGLIAEALRLLRTRAGLTQTAAGQLDGAPDFRTLSHWETRRKQPSLRLLTGYLRALGLDYHDLQDALDQVGEVGSTAGRLEVLDGQVDRLARAVEDLVERRMAVLEKRLELNAGRLAERLGPVERVGAKDSQEALSPDQDRDLAADLEHLAERVAAIERHCAQ